MMASPPRRTSIRRGRTLASLLVLPLLALALPAWAHDSSVAYSTISTERHKVVYRLQAKNAELFEALGFPEERDVTKADVLGARDKFLDYLSQSLQVTNDGQLCDPALKTIDFIDKESFFFAVFILEFDCRRSLSDVAIQYDLFFGFDERHQGLAQVQLPGEAPREHIFRNQGRSLRLSGRPTSLDHFRDYASLGTEHIFTGYDHLAFLCGLLLVAAALGLRGGLRYIFGIVTAFTLAHSLTLIAAGLGWVRLPSTIVEPAIALSIAYVAVENLLVARPRARWLLTFAFGLVHGFGFASVLSEIGLPQKGMILSLLAFNVGVEVGQLTVVLAVAPLILYAVPRFKLDRAVRRWGSVVLLLLAVFWLVERVFSLKLLGGRLG